MLELRHVSRVYDDGAGEVAALLDVSLAVEPGQLVAVMGPSGSGKSTLLAIAGTLEEPSSGEVLVGGRLVTGTSAAEQARLRRRAIGYVFQDFNLLPGLTATENVAMPLQLDGVLAVRARAVAARALAGLGLAERAGHFPEQLSGGERQRVAIARALVGRRRLLLADEPSGALDSANGEMVMHMIRAACRQGVAAVVVTHDAQLASWADRVVFLREGRLADEAGPPGPAAGRGRPVSAGVLEPPAEPELDDGGSSARLAVIHWAGRLFRREWRQQLLVIALLTVAVAATVLGAGVATNTPPANPNAGTYGTASALISLPGSDPHLTADIAGIQRRYRPADVIENQGLASGTVQAVWLRAQDPAGPYGGPLLALVAGRYPAGPGQVAMTSSVAALYGVGIGSTWHADGRLWRVTGIVENPSNLLDEFALISPGQLTAPARVTILVGTSHVHGLPTAASVSYPPPARGSTPGISPATIVLAVAVLGLVFTGLVAVAGFTVMAQRRLRALGMLSALGATEANVRLVMAANGVIVGLSGVTAGTLIGLAAWFVYAPHLQAVTAHTVDPLNLPWWVIVIAMVLGVVTATTAAVQPARAVVRLPVLAALSGRRPKPQAVRRPAKLGAGLLVAGVFFLALSGGLGSQSGGSLLVGMAAIAAGLALLAPLCLVALAGPASPLAPVAIRIALRDLVRYRARSGAALAATCFAVFLAMLICMVASIRFSDVLDWTGPNLTTSQLIVYTSNYPTSTGPGTAPSQAQLQVLHAKVDSFAASLDARAVLALDEAGTAVSGSPGGVLQGATLQAGHLETKYTGPLYVATPALLAEYGIKPSQIRAATDMLTMRPGLASLPGVDLVWDTPTTQTGAPSPAGRYIASPPMQTFSSLPSGTSAPNTVLTTQAVRRLHLQLIPYGWLIQAHAPLTATQISAARQLAIASSAAIETKSGELGLGEISDGATAVGILLALGVLVMTVGLIHSEAAGDLRTLTAAGAGSGIRRAIVGATAGVIGLLGAILGTAAAAIATLAWAKSSLSATFGGIPAIDFLLILVGLPAVAAIGGWLLAGRNPSAIARQPLE